jgi:hypothetical protein
MTKKKLLKYTRSASAVAAITLAIGVVGQIPAHATTGWERYNTMELCRYYENDFYRHHYQILVHCKYVASSGYYFQWSR